MARPSWRIIGITGLIFFFAQSVILSIYRRASEIQEQMREKVEHARSIGIESLLSDAPVSAKIVKMRKRIEILNQQQVVQNTDQFGSFASQSDSPVFVVQVHDRVLYLSSLIEALGNVQGIEECLLVFSHDIISNEINAVIRNITFARVLQIYYPYTMQLFPMGYPGKDPKGVSFPKGYGRTPGLVQIKLHWVWKLTQVFRGIRELRNHTGPKIFLEDDHYVLPDALHVLRQILTMRKTSCPTCLPILGGYPTEMNLRWDLIRLSHFQSSGNNMGMVLDQSFWNTFYKCGFEFCTIDDYNWDWTLEHLNRKCFPQPLKILKVDAPRVWHVGDCGTHFRHSKFITGCRLTRLQSSLHKVRKLVEQKNASMFPGEIKQISPLQLGSPDTPAPWGGWGDPRDHDLCLAIIKDWDKDWDSASGRTS
ncbi:hypothetical protein RvY_07395 [Ramazzottius varieornatus]|uniref:Alpha-1,6-mannosyl-glycoprotein 2-beta-N-acetylglucosaminyltransferase n=1 Tax=Ramazzottius varieornatus TaxID=947166 RepID=A0A1D1V4K7_RAMVA|nr:hypothetical protein RvY_07395 [Ramazzottius varieornatus]